MDRLALPDRSITWAPQARMQPKRWASVEQGLTVHVHDSIEEWTAMLRHSVRCVVTEQRTAEHSPTRAWQQRLGGASTSLVEADSAYEPDHSYWRTLGWIMANMEADMAARLLTASGT